MTEGAEPTGSIDTTDAAGAEEGLETRGRRADAPEGEPPPWTARLIDAVADRWRNRHRATTPEERREVIDRLLVDEGGLRTGRFWAMQGLAIVIATMGLSADSAAVVIGAMLVAPLMTPIMAVATALALGWPLRALRPLAGVAVASAGSVALAWLLHSAIPGAEVTDELLGRTSPDVRDLLVALAAGAAGALATARPDVSAALPGVAVAVALVPPLATTGAALELGRPDLASGAALLFVTNLVAIVLAGMFVLLASGFVPARLAERGRPAVAAGVLVTVVALVAVGIPLTARTVAAAEVAERNRVVSEAVQSWLEFNPDIDLTSIDIGDDGVRIDLQGPTEPVELPALTDRLRPHFDEEPVVDVRWSAQARPSAPDDEENGATELLDAAREAVATWNGDRDYEVAAVSLGAGRVVIDLVGAEPPSDPDGLAAAVTAAIGPGTEVEIRFTQRVTLDADQAVDPGRELAAVADEWAQGRGVEVQRLALTGDADGAAPEIVVDLVGESEPGGVAGLVDQLSEAAAELDLFDAPPSVRVRFIERRELTSP